MPPSPSYFRRVQAQLRLSSSATLRTDTSDPGYDSSDDDKPLALSPPKASGSRKAGASGSVRLTNGTGKKGINGKAVLEGKRSEDDKPLVKGKGKGTTNGKEKQKPPRKRTKKSESVDDADIESEDDKPVH